MAGVLYASVDGHGHRRNTIAPTVKRFREPSLFFHAHFGIVVGQFATDGEIEYLHVMLSWHPYL